MTELVTPVGHSTGDSPNRPGALRGMLGPWAEREARPSYTQLEPQVLTEISNHIRNTEPLLSEAPCRLDDYVGYRKLLNADTRNGHLTEMYYKVHQIAAALKGHVPDEEIRQAYKESTDFIYRAATEFSGERPAEGNASFVFAVPTRVMRNFNPFSFNGSDYRSEVTPFLPIARYVDAGIVQKLTVGLPPCVIEKYTPDEDGYQGRVLFVPIFGDKMFDLAPVDADGYADMRAGILASRRVSRDIITDAANFARDRLGARVMGLGAILPSLTKFGTTIDQSHVKETERLQPTTGHRVTVYMMAETARKVMDEADIEVGRTLGFIGAAGSIGESSTATWLHEFPDKNMLISDLPGKISALEKIRAKYGDRIEVAEDNLEVIKRSSIIGSAIVGRIDLDTLDPDRKLDLHGKVFIDDSQPGAFDRGQIEARGGYLLWVVGHDAYGRMKRVNGYTFGDEEGLVGQSKWGCEMEVQFIAGTKRYDLALTGPVQPEDITMAAPLLRDYGVVPGPFQSYGQLTHIPLRK